MCYNEKGNSIFKVRTGVVGHPVSEKGRQGGSPSLWQREHKTDRTRLSPTRRISLVNPSSQRRRSPLEQKERLNVRKSQVEGYQPFNFKPFNFQPKPGGTAEESFVPEWMKEFFY